MSTFYDLRIDIFDGLDQVRSGIPIRKNVPVLPTFKKHFESSDRSWQTLESGVPPGIKIGGTAGIWFPRGIEGIRAIIDLIYCTPGILVHLQIICIPPRRGPVTTPI